MLWNGVIGAEPMLEIGRDPPPGRQNYARFVQIRPMSSSRANSIRATIAVVCALCVVACTSSLTANPSVLQSQTSPAAEVAGDRSTDTSTGTATGTAPETASETATETGADTTVPPNVPTTGPGVATEISRSTSAGDPRYPSLGSSDIDVDHYDVVLDFQADHSLCGSVTISGRTLALTDRLAFDATELEVLAVTVAEASGAPLDQTQFRLADRELVLSLDEPTPAGGGFEAMIEFCDQIEPAGDFFEGAGLFPTDDGVWSVNEPDGVSTWMPVSDHPTDKATWTFAITVPDGLTAIANGAFAGSSATTSARSDRAATTWKWEQREPMASYLITLLIGEYTLVNQGQSTSGVSLDHAVLSSDREAIDPYLDVTLEQMAFFEQLFGPYPFDRYGLAITNSIGGLAMETQGLSLFSVDDLDGSLGYFQHVLLAHELAHQWFGDAVSPATWDDIWLNEGLATYGEWLWLDRVGLQTVESAAAVALGSTGPVYEPDELFASAVYQGGAAAIHTIRQTVGDDDFFAGLRSWVSTYLDQAATTAQFQAVMEEASGEDLDEVFGMWVYARAQPDSYPSAGR